jgi:hypothetical protein
MFHGQLAIEILLRLGLSPCFGNKAHAQHHGEHEVPFHFLAPHWIFTIPRLFLLLEGKGTTATSKLPENAALAFFPRGKLRLAPDSKAGIP